MQCCIHKNRSPSFKHHAMLSLAASAPVLCRAVRVLVLLLCTIVDSSVEAGPPRACNRTRAVLGGSYGKFGDGPGEYPHASHCQWLIEAEKPGQIITLNFSTLATECSYDHVYVYDGDTYDSPLLGVFSGHNFPAPVTAMSGRMLVMLYSDTNYALEGFEAEYFVTDCPLNCSSRGFCGDDHECICDDLHYGLGCELSRCPNNCHASMGNGLCFHPPILAVHYPPDPFCVCETGYFGESCSLGYSLGPSREKSWSSVGARPGPTYYVDEVGDKWHWLSRESRVPGQAFTPRTSHGIAYIPQLERLYIFGGYDLNSVLGDLVVYDIKNGTWLSVGDKKSQEINKLRQESRRIARLLHFSSPFLNENKVFDNPTAESVHQFDDYYLPVVPLRTEDMSEQALSGMQPAHPFVAQELQSSRSFQFETGSGRNKAWTGLNSTADRGSPGKSFGLRNEAESFGAYKNLVNYNDELSRFDRQNDGAVHARDLDSVGMDATSLKASIDKFNKNKIGNLDDIAGKRRSAKFSDRGVSPFDDGFSSSFNDEFDAFILKRDRIELENRLRNPNLETLNPDLMGANVNVGFDPVDERIYAGSRYVKNRLLDPRRGGKKPRIERKIQKRRRRMVPPESELNQATSAPDTDRTSRAAPAARFGHAMATYGTNFVVYGGKLGTGRVVAQLWMYNTTSETWSLLTNGSRFGSSSHPPGLMYSTLTFVPPHWLYVFGGNLPHGAFSNAMYRINMAAEKKTWQKVVYRGGSELDARLVGHSTIYHKRSHSLIIYGGIRVDIARFSKLSDRLLKFDLHNRFWSELRSPQDASSRDSNDTNHAPLERAFHTALVAGEYMVVYGGYLHKHKEEETCYDHSIYLYHLTCHTWLPRSFFTPLDRSGLKPAGRGVYGHGSFLLHERTVVVVGGFRGSVTNAVLAYVLPTHLRPHASARCDLYTTQAICVSGVSGEDADEDDGEGGVQGCVWCGETDQCHPRTHNASCTTNMQAAYCPGVCPLLSTCTACTLSSCTWCPYTRTCHEFEPHQCAGVDEQDLVEVVGSMAGVTESKLCGTAAGLGLTYSLYRRPVDLKRPDVVSINNDSSLLLELREEFRGARSELGHRDVGVPIARLHGFLIPGDPNLTLKLSADNLNASLWVEGEEKQTIIGGGKNPISTGNDIDFPDAPGPAYEIQIEGRSHGSLRLEWRGGVAGKEAAEDVHKKELRVYRSGKNCGSFRTCLACATDAACGWCPVNGGSCISNTAPCFGKSHPEDEEEVPFFPVLVASQCPVCQQHIYCTDCASDGDCEWLSDAARCTRRGRFEGRAVTNASQCPPECHRRQSCAQCLGTSGRCAWCQPTQECFLFSVYTSVYQYGACRAWLDEDHTNVTAPDDSQQRSLASRNRKPPHDVTSSHEGRGYTDGSTRSSTEEDVDDCVQCGSAETCVQCMQTLECGWCYNTLNPTLGACVRGHYSAPRYGDCSEYVSPIIDRLYNESLTPTPSPGEPTGPTDLEAKPPRPRPIFDPNVRTTGYSYTSCPDVDECFLQLHKCHELANCTNTEGSYNCTCKQGFKGDGFTGCERTCNVTCVHGRCSNAPHYTCDCDLGWTGVDCSIDCGCHNHSTCSGGIGKCDSCQDNTYGQWCQLCKGKSWGNATTPDGCKLCACNGHGDDSMGTCHRETGQCYCKDNTRGRYCEQCEDGYYGNPAKGGNCYTECRPRNVIYGATTGHIGAQRYATPLQQHSLAARLASAGGPLDGDGGFPKSSYLLSDNNGEVDKIGNRTETCLWIVTPYKSIYPPPQDSVGTHVILFALEDLHVPCGSSTLLVFDGMPQIVSQDPTWDRRNHVLASYCSEHSGVSKRSPGDGGAAVLEARSGYLTVLLQKRLPTVGFSSSYSVLSCPDRPGDGRICVDKKPVCAAGAVGGECDEMVCPDNCNAARGHGTCDEQYGRCVCWDGYTGHDCGALRQRHMVVVEELFEVHKVRSASQLHLLTVLPRFGHSMLSDHRGVLWLFGGYSLSRGSLNDVIQFDSKTNSWVEVTVTVQPGKQPPPRRYFHSAAYVPSKRSMFIYGGLSEHRYLSDLWSFSVDSEGWTLLDRPVVASGRSSDGSLDFLLPPPLAGHTLTYCNDGEKEVLILIGGVSDVYGFLDVVWEYRVTTGEWSVLETTGTSPLGVFGHSTVYHAKDRVFYVYGGYTYNVDKVSLLGELYAFHYPTKVWSLLPPDKKINSNPSSRPSPRAFHTAVTSSDYLLIIGGYVEEQRDSHQTLIVYSYKCNMWIPLNQYLITLVGPELPPLLGLAAAAYEDTAYIYGGYNGVTHGGMMSIYVPQDLCTLNANETQCRDRIGCANCVVFNDLGNNSSHCYSNDRNAVQPKECFGPSGGMVPGKVCDASLLQKDCYQYTSCAACVAQYPAVAGSKPKCKWCRHCNKTKCIPKGNNCVTENTCEKGSNKADVNDTKVIEDADQCPEKSCAASDCAKCKDLQHCIWTRQVMRSHATFTLNFKPVYDWNCVDNSILNHSSFVVQATPPQACPARCHSYMFCSDCLKSYGSEGGWQGCYWSENLRTCISPSYAPIACLGGRCGVLLQEPPCPLPCSMHLTCSSCLEHPRCGWCALDTPVGGLGVCRDGGLEAPSSRACEGIDYDHFLKNTSVVTLHGLSPAGPLPAASWHYLKCPAEDECRSGHHDCHPQTQECVDEVEGFSCRCAAGYNTSLDGSCVPLCEQGCLHGTCVEPNSCLCNFGYVGFNCSIKCKCNGHSDCRGPDRLTECIKCHNNTEGDQCERCMDFFVGDPTKDEACVSCFVYCNHHTNECYPVAEGSTFRSSAITNVEDLPARSGMYSNTMCSNCANNTAGVTCGSCMLGFFRGSSDGKDGCKPCECNGHAKLCDPVWGDDCSCANNTMSPCSSKSNNRGLPSKDEDKDCQKKQCTKCKDAYLGTPSGGHHCYFQMSVEKEYCLDSESQSRCDGEPRSVLRAGQTAFFGVQPKFMNVNIRLVLDITKGRVKVYFSSEDNAFLVKVNETSWRHVVEIDSNYRIQQDRPTFLAVTKAQNRNYIGNGLGMHDIINVASSLAKDPSVSVVSSSAKKPPSNYSTLHPEYRLIERKARGLKTFITVEEPTDILIVHNITNRLVITLPQNGHDLRSARFYIVIQGMGEDDEVAEGSVFFRQDQPRIDLFVFFSVFFSCFFLFLAVCVVVWKVKQSFDLRRARRRHVVEMLHMARRPFAITTLVLQDSEPRLVSETTPLSPETQGNTDSLPWSPVRRKRGSNKKDSLQHQVPLQQHQQSNQRSGTCPQDWEVGPVAVEPTDDGIAAVVTVVVQLPGFGDPEDGGPDGGAHPPSHRLALGSALCQVARIYPPASKQFQIRRRVSHGAS